MERSSTHTTVQGASVMQVPEGSWPSGQCEPGVWKGRTDDGRRHAKYRAAWGHLSGPLRLDNPYEMDRPPSQYPDEGTLVALLHHWEIDTRSIQQVIATVRGGGMAVLPIRFTAAQLQAAFPPERTPRVCLDARDKGGQTRPPASGEIHQTAERLRAARVSDAAERGSMTQRCTGYHLAGTPLYQGTGSV